MKTTEFIDEVARHEGFASPDEARDATHATLTSLSQLLTQGESEDLADQLPAALRDWTASTKDKPQSGAQFSTEQFVDQVADRLSGDVGRDQAEESARRVLHTLRDSITDGEWEDFTSQLPTGFERLLV